MTHLPTSEPVNTSIVRHFIKALVALEKSKQAERMAVLFSDEAELVRPGIQSPLRGKAGTWHFWRDYQDTFQEVHSRFTRILETRSFAVLEWVSEGVLHSGAPIQYHGVTLLEFTDDRIVKMRTYFDSAAFSEAERSFSRSGARSSSAA